jgi:hypothetical protein
VWLKEEKKRKDKKLVQYNLMFGIKCVYLIREQETKIVE